MKKKSLSINMFMIDGTIDSAIKCTESNWTGIVLRVPRQKLDEYRNRPEMKQSSIYLLFGTNEKTQEPTIYIGQASERALGTGPYQRFQEHNKSEGKTFWDDTIIITTRDNSLGATELCFLENHFYKAALKAARFSLANNVEPKRGRISEEKESEMLDFAEHVNVLVGLLGYKAFEPLISEDMRNDEDIFKLSVFEAQAKMKRTDEGFVVLSGSKIRNSLVKSCPGSVKRSRKLYSAAIDTATGTLKKDLLFKSPSGASSFVIGRSSNGWIEWKNDKNKSLKEVLKQENE